MSHCPELELCGTQDVYRAVCFLPQSQGRRIQLLLGPSLELLSALAESPDNQPPAAAAAKSLQSCPTLCDPIDGSPPGSSVPGILQARTLEWGAIALVSSLSQTLQPMPMHLATHFLPIRFHECADLIGFPLVCSPRYPSGLLASRIVPFPRHLPA